MSSTFVCYPLDRDQPVRAGSRTSPSLACRHRLRCWCRRTESTAWRAVLWVCSPARVRGVHEQRRMLSISGEHTLGAHGSPSAGRFRGPLTTPNSGFWHAECRCLHHTTLHLRTLQRSRDARDTRERRAALRKSPLPSSRRLLPQARRQRSKAAFAAPRSRRSLTASVWPFRHASIRAVQPLLSA